MRRKDRELTEMNDLLQILDRCKVCRIAMIDGSQPYIVPMNYGYELKEGNLYLYFHCAKEGKKINILNNNDNVCYEMDCEHELVEGKIACNYGYAYASIIGNGKVEFIEELNQKETALMNIMRHQTGRTDFTFDENMVKRVTVFRISSNDFTGKRRLRK